MQRTSIREEKLINSLFILTLTPERSDSAARLLGTFDARQHQRFLELANSHHVVVRALSALRPVADTETRNWIDAALDAENSRISTALPCLAQVCRVLDQAECPITVMKSLDHWPDLGNDIDLFTTAPERMVVEVFENQLGAGVEQRSWGDRLAKKWNFRIPGLKESIEVHCERLGQTGEHIALARRFVTRRVPKQLEGYTFMVPAPEERIIVATLQRMYRHFYFRVCDIVNSAALVESGVLDYKELQRASMIGGIWPGVATYLKIVSDFVERYRGKRLALPESVLRAARFGGAKISLSRGFLRVPILPEGAELYTKEIAAAARRGDIPAAARLSLLPPLASAAAVAYKFTGTDKGIW